MKKLYLILFMIILSAISFGCNRYEYKPASKAELIKLLDNKSINLAKIDIREITDLSELFAGSSRQDFTGISKWDTSNVRNMSGMFFNMENFNEDISSWNVEQVEDMSYMFEGAVNFNQDISDWNTSKVINMRGMFYEAAAFNQDISSWNTEKVEDMYDMFYGSPLAHNPPEWYVEK